MPLLSWKGSQNSLHKRFQGMPLIFSVVMYRINPSEVLWRLLKVGLSAGTLNFYDLYWRCARNSTEYCVVSWKTLSRGTRNSVRNLTFTHWFWCDLIKLEKIFNKNSYFLMLVKYLCKMLKTKNQNIQNLFPNSFCFWNRVLI